MTALVTGGTGFIGTHLIDVLLKTGYRVRCLAKDRMYADSFPQESVELVIGNVCDSLPWESIFDGVDYVFHLAGVTRAKRKKDYFRGNYYATRHFLDVCRRYGRDVRKFIYVSSLAVAGPCRNGQPVNEQTPCLPISAYGWSKLLAEQEVLRYRDQFPVVILRPCAVYGPRERDFYAYMKMVKRGFRVLIGGRESLFSFLHVHDLANALVLAAEHPNSTGETYYLGSEEPFSTRELGETLADVMGTRPPLCIRVPLWLTYTAGWVSQGIGWILNKPVFLNTHRVKEMVQSVWSCSISKAKRDLGFMPLIGLREGLASTYAWYVEHAWL
ncbi:MAG: NAD-dependent epimerase/dehydratase family protein [Bacteroidota bacterium]